jgi:acyl dehydratase
LNWHVDKCRNDNAGRYRQQASTPLCGVYGGFNTHDLPSVFICERQTSLGLLSQLSAFAAEFDPQPFHLNEDSARETFFKGLAASGWHTAAMTMRLLVDSELKPVGGIIGTGFDEMRWPRPVRPGDQLHVESEVLDVRPSKSRPHQGVIKVRTTTLNQNGEPVQLFVGNLIVLRRSTSSGEKHR